MVTISIVEQEGIITSLFKQSLAQKGLCFCRSTDSGRGDYLFLPSHKPGSRDVVLLNHFAQDAVQGDYITILNADDKIPDYNRKSLVITYGLNSLATLTASSIKTEENKTTFFCCIQRSIATLKGKILEPQEFPVCLPMVFADIGPALGFVALGLVLSFEPVSFETLFTIRQGKKAKQFD